MKRQEGRLLMKRNIEAETPHWSMKQRADIKKNRSNFGCFDKNQITSVTMNYDLGMLKKKEVFLKATLVTRSSSPTRREKNAWRIPKRVRETTRNGKTSDPQKTRIQARIENSDPRKTQTPRVFQKLRPPKNSVRDFMALNNLRLFSYQQLRKYRNLESLCTRNGMKYLQNFADACCVMLVMVQWPDLVWNITAHTAIKTSCDSNGITKN